jgi:hypothetical protein
VGSIASPTFFLQLKNEYRRSLKPPETEELINQLVNRPLAFLAAKILQKLKATPNFVTLLSLLSGVSSGFIFSRGRYPDILLAALLLQFMIIFDCADGQLARLTNRSSKLGRILDSLADLATHCSIYWGVAIGLYRHTGTALPFFLALSAQISMYLHMALFDHFKSVFITIARPDCIDQLDSLDTLKAKIGQLETKSSRLSSMLRKIFLWFSMMESRVVSIGYTSRGRNFYEQFPDRDNIDPQTRELYYNEMRVPTKLWTMIGDTIHLTIFVVCGLLNRAFLIFPIILVYTNVVMVVALFVQRVKYRNLSLEHGIQWQERFD